MKRDPIKCRELADVLDMMASQTREHADDPENRPPHPWAFDDWVRAYREWYEGHNGGG